MTPASAHDLRRTRALVFVLVTAAFASVYVTQPVLPVLQAEFALGASQASLSISAVIAGIAVASLPLGSLADRLSIRPLIGVGAAVVALACLGVALTDRFALLVVARFVQGLALPTLTSALATYLARSLPPHELNVALGAYVSASVAGGLFGRLLGGWIHPPLHWRYAFVTAALLVTASAIAAWRGLPREAAPPAVAARERLGALLRDGRMLGFFATGAGAFCAFSSVFNYFPFYLAAPPLSVPTTLITSLYLTYVVGIVMGPLAGRLANALGNGATIMLASVVLAGSLLLTLIAWLPGLVVAMMGVCAGFFTLHASAVGGLNRARATQRGRANALYMLFYYIGGTLGITASGFFFTRDGWAGVALFNAVVLAVPLAAGFAEARRTRGGAGISSVPTSIERGGARVSPDREADDRRGDAPDRAPPVHDR